MRSRVFKGALAALAVPLALAGGATAYAHQGHADQRQADEGSAATASDGKTGATSTVRRGRSSFSAQHNGPGGHLPAARENIDVISKFEPTSQGPIVPGQIADLSVFKGFAYLNSWTEPTCSKGGFYVVDIRDPARPREVAFRRAQGGTYHGEGAHVISVNTPTFRGDIAAFNNEICDSDDPQATGGFDLYDVSNPTNPIPLAIGAGDTTEGGSAEPTPEARANSAHSVFLWQAGDRAYAVAVDNLETTDVDIFDITNPRLVRRVGEFDLAEMFPQIVGSSAQGDSIFLHDMVVKEIGGRQIMLASYWDSGYVQLDVTDPANPTHVTDTDFGPRDPLTGLEPPEGNGHYAEFSGDNRFVLGADEDFSPFRLPRFSFTTGPNEGDYPAGEFGFTRPIATLEDNTLNGPTRFGGYGCDARNQIPDRSTEDRTLGSDEEAILVLQRGPVRDPSNDYAACTFQEKVDNAAERGWDAVIIGNHHTGSGAGAAPDATICGGGTSGDIPAACIGHRAMHLLFRETPSYEVPYNRDDPNEPAVGAEGDRITTTSVFDGWGYAHVFDRATSRELGAYAIAEALDERYAFGFGDLSIHEWATDPEVNLAYASYYAGGVRVVSFGQNGMEEQGKFIDRDGSNFWGVEQFNDAGGNRLIAASDRDFGLYILRYTGPGAPQPPRATQTPTETPTQTPTQTPTSTSTNRGPCDAPLGGASRTAPRGLSLGLTRKGGFRRNQTGIVKRGQRKSARGRSLRVTSRGRMTPPTGRAVCGGKVLVRIKSGKLTLSSRTVNLRADGTYVSTVRLKLPRRITKARLSVRARFLGNEPYLPKSARARTVRALR